MEFTTDPPSTIVRIVIGEIKTNISKKSIASIINQLSIRASMFSWAARFMSPNCTGAVTAKGFLQKNSKDAGRVDSLIMENGLTKRKLAPGFQVTFTEEVV